MMILVQEIRLPLQSQWEDAYEKALRKAGVYKSQVESMRPHKISVDARRKEPVLVYSVAMTLKSEKLAEKCTKRAGVRVVEKKEISLSRGKEALPGKVVVCGLGPAGLFCALELAAAGFEPVVLERGMPMEERALAVKAFEEGGTLLKDTNIQFGEGGAGTFSDGKLVSRIGDALCGRVIDTLLSAGAPKEIAWRAKPHIGTDKLRDVFVTLRKRLQELGGKVMFATKMTDIKLKNGLLNGLDTTNGEIPCGILVLANGHSARDTFSVLNSRGVTLLPKQFSVGVRIEHLQEDIDKGLYHEAAGHKSLPAGEYQLSTRHGKRGVYTFCMCPGGQVVAAASEEGGVVTNGMSMHARSGKNANAALVVNVGPNDFEDGPFGGIQFQRNLEKAAFIAGGKNYSAPAQTVGDFLNKKTTFTQGRVVPTYPRGVTGASLDTIFSGDISDALKAGIADFGRKLPGFDTKDAVLSGVETRTSSPVRMPRDEQMESESLSGVYPCGEGAGYAGGIMSAAVDGIKVAHAIIRRYTPNIGV